MHASSPAVIGLGEAMVLFLAEQPGALREATSFTRHVAGAESNVAVGVSRLGASAGFISRIGDDEFGAAIAFRLRGEGVDTSYLRTDPEAPTGLIFRERREVGPVDVVYYRRNSAASRLAPSDLPEDYVRGARYLVLSGITPALSSTCQATVFAAAEMARGFGVTVVFDPNIRLKLWSIETARPVLLDLVRLSDIVLPGIDEAALLTTESHPLLATRALAALGPRLVITKLGAQGALAVDSGGEVLTAPGVPLQRVIDPVGAGDAFAAGFLAAQLRDFSLAESLNVANACGAHAMTLPADQECLPYWSDLTTPQTTDVRR